MDECIWNEYVMSFNLFVLLIILIRDWLDFYWLFLFNLINIGCISWEIIKLIGFI